jgi:hypothetical protein
MRKFLLASAAVTALVAGPAIANAQSAPKSQDTPAATSQQQAPKGSARDDAETKRAPSGERRDTTGTSSQSSPMKDKGGPSGAAAGSDQPASKGQGSKSSQDMQREDRSKAQKSGGSDMQKQKSGASDTQKQKSGGSDMQKGTTGASQGAQGAQPSDQRTGQPKSSSTPSDQRSTTGQSPSDQRMKGDRMNRDQQPSGRQGETQTDQRTGTSGTADQRNQAGSSRSSTSTTTTATPEVQSKFSETIEKQRVRSVDKVNFSVSVGTTVPRSVRFYDVPSDIVTIHPEFRGKKFLVVRDEIVIVEPRTHKVVSVIPRSGRATTGTATSTRQTTSSKLNLAPEKRRVIRETVIKEQAAPRCADLQISVGAEVPRSLQLRPLPDVVITEVPEIRSYNFCIKGDDVVLVDPSDYRIVEVVE